MLDTEAIKALLFDFGGTIDTGGLHWVHVLYSLWEERLPGLDPAKYRLAFAHGERTLAKEKIILRDDNFLDLLEKKLAIQAAFLKENNIACTIRDQKAVADKAYQQAEDNCNKYCTIIENLKDRYRIAMVSNFYGNLGTVLKDFDIHYLFETVTESALVGVKKPDPQIWQLGCDSLGISPVHCLAIGDSMTKDMVPATSIGCLGLWLQGRGWEDELSSGQQQRHTEKKGPTTKTIESEKIYQIQSLDQLTQLL